ncbi:MAG: ribosome biogenesis GTPase Der, partial [candidate division NC10 bacterium]|nr:ribosome biogenesis GTPase Der [candidate division NC10 bacterium]
SPESELEKPVTVAVIGRPNVGKSSLVNRILGEERVIVDDLPGTTRDAVDTPFVYRDKPYLLIDTAGIRAPGKVKDLERYSILRAERRVERADVALVIIDASQGVTAQDTKIAGIAHEAGCGIILVANKWDLVGDELADEFILTIKDRLKYLDYAPIVLASAKTGLRVMHCLDVVEAVNAEREKRIPTPRLNAFIGEVVAKFPPPPSRGRKVKIRFVTQTKGAQPTFLFFIDGAPSLHFSYERYLENRLREAYGFQGVPLRLIFRERKRG